MITPDPKRVKTLTIDFDLYTDGDPVFKKELIEMMMDNIRELMQACEVFIRENNPDIFRKTSHKVISTLTMIDNKELTDAVTRLKNSTDPETRKALAIVFKGLCDDSLNSLATAA